MNNNTNKSDVYSFVTQQIISQLERGTVPWQQPWTKAGHPQNPISKSLYHGINVWLLASLGYDRNLFLTLRQIKECGGSLKKNVQGHVVISTTWIDKKIIPEKCKLRMQNKRGALQYTKVFNIDQCEGIPFDKSLMSVFKKPSNTIPACQAIYKNMPDPPEILEKHDFAYYSGYGDYINMPLLAHFETSESYYCSLFHELIHSTRIASRLNRNAWIRNSPYTAINEDKYSLEELVAEMGASYLASLAGIVISPDQPKSECIVNWIRELKSDKFFIVIAGALAQKAVNYILNFKSKEEENTAIELDTF